MVTFGPVHPQCLAKRDNRKSPLRSHHGTHSPRPSNQMTYGISPPKPTPGNDQRHSERSCGGTTKGANLIHPLKVHTLLCRRPSVVGSQKPKHYPPNGKTRSQTPRALPGDSRHFTCVLSIKTSTYVENPQCLSRVPPYPLQRNYHKWTTISGTRSRPCGWTTRMGSRANLGRKKET